jgi:hypothetical protein
MSDEKKETQIPSLSELAYTVEKIVAALIKHTIGRAGLYYAVGPEAIPSTLELNGTSTDNLPFKVTVDPKTLSKDTFEEIILGMIENEEKLAMNCWKDILGIAATAVDVIKQIEASRLETVGQTEDPELISEK